MFVYTYMYINMQGIPRWIQTILIFLQEAPFLFIVCLLCPKKIHEYKFRFYIRSQKE